MGKRRPVFEHKDPRSMNDDDDDDDEDDPDIIVEEPISQEQRDLITKRKKLVPKRKFGTASAGSIPSDSPFATLKPFPTLPTSTTTTTCDDGENKSVFTGFKGFTGFKPLVPTGTTTTNTSSLTNPVTNLSTPVNTSEKSSTTMTTTTTSNAGLSLFTNGFNNNTSNSSSTPASTSTCASTSTPTNGVEHAKPTDKNVNEAEMKFIMGLNELYERCYGGSVPKRQYRLPIDALETTNDTSDQSEAKYASLLAALNRNCSKWISKHVEESPFVILTPVFVDYFNYLILLEKNFFPETFKQAELQQQQQPPQSKATTMSVTILNGVNGHKEHATASTAESEKNNFFKMPSEKKPSEETTNSLSRSGESSAATKFSLPALASNSASSGLFKFGSSTSTPTDATASATNGREMAANDNESKKRENVTTGVSSEEKAKSIGETTTTNTQPTLPIFKFGGENSSIGEPKFGFGNNTTLGTTKSPIETSAESTNNLVSTGSTGPDTAASKPISFFSLLNKDKEKEKEKEESKTTSESSTTSSIFKTFGSTTSPFAVIASSSSTVNAPSISTTSTAGATTTTPIFSFGSGAATSSGAPLLSATSTSTASSTPSPFSSFQAGGFAKSSNLFGTSSSIFGSSTSGVLGSTASSILAPSASADPEAGDEDKEEYQPPKPESSDVKEEGSVLTKRIKLFYFNDKEKKFTDRGIGNLFVKPVQKEASAETTYQLVIRADNKLAQILLNVKLSKVFPVTREGPKDVSYLCLPNPPIQNVDAAVPCKFLFKVKTEADADELLNKLNEYKK